MEPSFSPPGGRRTQKVGRGRTICQGVFLRTPQTRSTSGARPDPLVYYATRPDVGTPTRSSRPTLLCRTDTFCHRRYTVTKGNTHEPGSALPGRGTGGSNRRQSRATIPGMREPIQDHFVLFPIAPHVNQDHEVFFPGEHREDEARKRRSRVSGGDTAATR